MSIKGQSKTKQILPPNRRSDLRLLHANAAGIDCGSQTHYVAVPADQDEQPIRCFKTVTGGLHQLADWLRACGIETVAMESTGVYWIPVYEILEARGFEVVLVNARHVKNVPGRKTDVVDCQWLQQLHTYGLLRGSFRPDGEITQLRAYVRQRDTLLQSSADQIRRMQKALSQMNVQLHTVLSDITGKTGMLILREIVAGQRDPKSLARHRDRRCKASNEEIEAALTGNYRVEHLFALEQNLALFDFLQSQIEACDQALEQLLNVLCTPNDPVEPTRVKKRRTRNRHTPRFDVAGLLERLTGSDLTRIDGIDQSAALRIVSEVGIDMSRWPSENHFASWTTLAPMNKITGGKRISSRTQRSANRVASTLRMCAMSVGRTQSALGAYYRRLAYRVGKAKAITATARKLAILVYKVLSGTIVYDDPGAEAYEADHRERSLRALRHRASKMGFVLTPEEKQCVVVS